MNVEPLSPLFFARPLDPKYMQAIDRFQPRERTFRDPQEITELMLQHITCMAIISVGMAAEQRQVYYDQWSLNQISCHIMQNVDMEAHTDTPQLIEQASDIEKGFFTHILVRLARQGFDIRSIGKSTLLFSIHRIRHFIPEFVRLWQIKSDLQTHNQAIQKLAHNCLWESNRPSSEAMDALKKGRKTTTDKLDQLENIKKQISDFVLSHQEPGKLHEIF